MMERISWIDIEKGLAIVLMVIGHSALPQNLSNFIFAFHMPVFLSSQGFAPIMTRITLLYLQRNA